MSSRLTILLFTASTMLALLTTPTSLVAKNRLVTITPETSSDLTFLSPAKDSLFLSQQHPRVRRACRNNNQGDSSDTLALEVACPKFLPRHGSPFIPPAFKPNLPDLSVHFTIDQISNVTIAGKGLDATDHGLYVVFFVDSTASTEESPGESSGIDFSNFGPNSTRFFNFVFWSALVKNGCLNISPSSFPVELFSSALSGGPVTDGVDKQLYGEFEATDNSTIISTGFWNILYTIRASNKEGDIADITFKGKASAVCSSGLY